MKLLAKRTKLLIFAAMALIGYPLALVAGAGALFVAFATIGAAGEIGLWAALIRHLRGGDRVV